MEDERQENFDTEAMRQENLRDKLLKFQKSVHRTAVEKGWWNERRDFGTMIALMHSELSEALEAYRKGNPWDDKIPTHTGIEAELADCIIRILDLAEGNSYDVIGAMLVKAQMNKSREYRHGNKKC